MTIPRAARKGGFFLMTSRRPFVASCLAALLAACTSVPAPPPAESGVTVWHPVLLPGKRATDYGLELKDGRLH